MDTVTVRNKGATARAITDPQHTVVVEPHGTADVPKHLAVSLLEQTDRWELVAADSGEEA